MNESWMVATSWFLSAFALSVALIGVIVSLVFRRFATVLAIVVVGWILVSVQLGASHPSSRAPRLVVILLAQAVLLRIAVPALTRQKRLKVEG